MSKESEANKILLDKKIDDVCCYDHEYVVICNYRSGKSWLLCNQHDQDEAFQLGRISRTRISS